MQPHIANQFRNGGLCSDNTLHVIGVVFNPMMYHSRQRLFKEWERRMLATPNVKVYVVELAFGDRHFECTDANNPNHLQLRARQEIWHKESLINLAEERLLPNNWKYMSWCDTDVFFPDDSWAQQALHELQHFNLIQPWEDAIDLGFMGTIMQTFESFCSLWANGKQVKCGVDDPYPYGHTGFVWCCRREWWEQIQKLVDFAILGSADHHMAWAACGLVQKSIHGGMGAAFRDMLIEHGRLSFRSTQGRLGYIQTRIEHGFHGPKAARRYKDRWKILVGNNFDPKEDLMYDAQGLVSLTGNKPDMQQDCYNYLSERNEDSIEDQIGS